LINFGTSNSTSIQHRQASETKVDDDKPKRARIVPVKGCHSKHNSSFSNEQVALDTAQAQ
jgi:hypothetical protein